MSLSSPTPTPSSTSLLTPGATVTNVLALTTPFAQKPDCASIWGLTEVSTHIDGVATTVAILVSNVDDERFTSCQPSGWGSVISTSRFSFSPAVCPSDWTYYRIASEEQAGTTSTTAYCCARCVLRAILLVFIISYYNTLCSLYDEALLILTAAGSLGRIISGTSPSLPRKNHASARSPRATFP